MKLPAYLEENIHRISAIEDQTFGKWRSTYDDEVLSGFDVMTRLKTFFPDKIINRKDIIDLYRAEDKQLAMTATMVWGLLSASRPHRKGDRTTTNFYMMLSHPENVVRKTFNDITSLLREGKIEEAYRMLDSGGEYKIPGVGPAFFTKIMFFIGQAEEAAITGKPLIFDYWTTSACFALLAQSDRQKLRTFFKAAPGKKTPYKIVSGLGAKLYCLYVESMNSWAAALSSRAGNTITPARLEEFIFGTDKNRKKTDNPRIELEKIVLQNLCLLD